MTTEDLQEKYRDRKGELHPAVPLAADAAHLLTEYLDSMAVELVRHGIAEPYRITREYEEIFVQELQQLGKTGKLSYDVTEKMLDGYGEPVEVIRKYIVEHDLQGQEILARPKDSGEVIPKIQIEDGGWQSRLEYLWQRSGKAIMSLLMVFAFGMALGYEIFLLTQGLFYPYDDMYAMAPFFFLPFAAMEIVTGLRGSGIRESYYHFFRELTKFLLSVNTIVLGMRVIDHTNSPRFFERYLPTFLLIWAGIYGISWIKDHTDLLRTTTSREKPVARFFLPSYLVLFLTYGISALVLLINGDSYNERYFVNDAEAFLMVCIVILAVLSILMDMGRKYPLSIKKLGYTITLLAVPLLLFSYNTRRFSYWNPTYLYDLDLLLTYSIAMIVLFGISIPLLFRAEIKDQLNKYREHAQLQLDAYRESD